MVILLSLLNNLIEFQFTVVGLQTRIGRELKKFNLFPSHFLFFSLLDYKSNVIEYIFWHIPILSLYCWIQRKYLMEKFPFDSRSLKSYLFNFSMKNSILLINSVKVKDL